MILNVDSENQMKSFGQQLADSLSGGEVIELVGDVGAGKTTFTKGLASGLMVDDDVQSPSFTISRLYPARDGLQLAHYDFYRLNDAGILNDELAEVVRDDSVVLVIEWADIVNGVLPDDRLRLLITATGEETRQIELIAGGPKSRTLLEKIR